MTGSDIEEYEFVCPFCFISCCDSNGVSRISKVDEVCPLHHTARMTSRQGMTRLESNGTLLMVVERLVSGDLNEHAQINPNVLRLYFTFQSNLRARSRRNGIQCNATFCAAFEASYFTKAEHADANKKISLRKRKKTLAFNGCDKSSRDIISQSGLSFAFSDWHTRSAVLCSIEGI